MRYSIYKIRLRAFLPVLPFAWRELAALSRRRSLTFQTTAGGCRLLITDQRSRFLFGGVRCCRVANACAVGQATQFETPIRLQNSLAPEENGRIH